MKSFDDFSQVSESYVDPYTKTSVPLKNLNGNSYDQIVKDYVNVIKAAEDLMNTISRAESLHHGRNSADNAHRGRMQAFREKYQRMAYEIKEEYQNALEEFGELQNRFK